MQSQDTFCPTACLWRKLQALIAERLYEHLHHPARQTIPCFSMVTIERKRYLCLTSDANNVIEVEIRVLPYDVIGPKALQATHLKLRAALTKSSKTHCGVPSAVE